MSVMKKCFILVFLMAFVFGTYGEEARLLRFPHIQGNKIVFSYAGDLYTVDATRRKVHSFYWSIRREYGSIRHARRRRTTQTSHLYRYSWKR